jgi:hypothetical protein
MAFDFRSCEGSQLLQCSFLGFCFLWLVSWLEVFDFSG